MKEISINSPETRAFLKYVTLLLLLLNGTGSMIGGIPMIAFPDGSANGIPLSYLEHSPFSNFLIPGIVLVVCNGMLSLSVFFALIFDVHFHSRLVIVQGVVLTGWIITQVLMVREINFLHVSFCLVGIVLILLGKYLVRFDW